MGIDDAISEAIANAKPAPTNEAATCHLVIVPLIQACGYSLRDIGPQQTDSYGKCPDYIILAGAPYAWYLEAKCWGEKLDKHEPQLIQYSASTGARWGVLTDGCEWRLYDTNLTGIARDRLVASARLDDIPSSTKFFEALAKTSVEKGGIETYALNLTLARILGIELANPKGGIIQRLCKALQKENGLRNLKPADLADYFTPARQLSPVASSSTTLQSTAKRSQAPISTPTISAKNGTAVVAKRSLDKLLSNPTQYITGKKPTALYLPDGTTTTVSNWSEVICEIVKWLGSRGQLPPMPYTGTIKGKDYFLNTVPCHAASKKMRAPKTLQVGNNTIYLEAHRSASDCIVRINSLCNAVGAKPSEFAVDVN